MLFEVEKTGDLSLFAENLSQITNNSSLKAALVLVCDENGWTKEALDPLLTRQPIPVFGGVFPKLILRKEVLDKGSLVIGIVSEPQIAIIKGLSDPNADYEEMIDEAIGEGFDPSMTMTDSISQSRIGSFGQTSLVMVDGLASRITPFVDGLFNVLGVEENYIGGGAGSLSLKQKPCIITPQGLIADAAVLVGFEWYSGIGVAHGWEKVVGPFVVTESEGAVIKSLNWRPAADVYKETVEPLLGAPITEENFMQQAMAYPLGIVRLGGNHIVRDPIFMKGETLVCVGDVPLESHVDILHGSKAQLIEAARSATATAQSRFPKESEALGAFIIDCISRWLYLGEDFSREMEAVQIENTPVFGVLTLGEIANKHDEFLEFYNKTTVIGIVGKA